MTDSMRLGKEGPKEVWISVPFFEQDLILKTSMLKFFMSITCMLTKLGNQLNKCYIIFCAVINVVYNV